jgi:hypothetical protein
MATIQINTSKNPMIGAMFLYPLVMKIIRMVSNETSQILITKINRGSNKKSK